MVNYLPLTLMVAAVLFYATAIVSLVLGIWEITKPSFKSAAVFHLYRKATVITFVLGTLISVWMLVDITGVLTHVITQAQALALSAFSPDWRPLWSYLWLGMNVLTLVFLVLLYQHLKRIHRQTYYRVLNHD